MDYKKFISEAPRVYPASPPKSKELNPTQKAVKDAGDVGKREIVQKATGKTVSNKNYGREARKLTTKGIDTQWDDGLSREVGKTYGSDVSPQDTVPDTPAPSFKKDDDSERDRLVDRALTLTAPDAMKQKKREAVSDRQGAGASPELQSDFEGIVKALQAKREGKPVDPKYDYEDLELSQKQKELGARAKISAAKLTDQQKDLVRGIEYKDGEPVDQESAPERMDRAARAIGPLGALTGDKNVDDEMNKLIRSAQSGNVRAQLKLRDLEIDDLDDIIYTRHSQQPEASNLPRVLDADAISTLGALTSDKREGSKLKRDSQEISSQKKKVGENPLNPSPSKRDYENLDDRLLKKNYESGKLTKKEYDKQLKINKALLGDGTEPNAEALQKEIFTHEVDDDAIDQFMQMYAGAELSNVGGRGLDPKRMKAAYGGDLESELESLGLSPKDIEEFKVEGAPDGVWNLAAMQKAKNADIRKLVPIANQNRLKGVIETYLKQGGRDAYARHEGIRSILDMNLEHIHSLDAGGYDHPDNWSWAGEELNKFKNARNLIAHTQSKLDDEKEVQVPQEYQRSTFSDITQKAKAAETKKEQQKWKDSYSDFFGGKSPTIGAGGIPAASYLNFDADTIQSFRQKAMDEFGVDQEVADSMFPTPKEVVTRKGLLDGLDDYEAARLQKEKERVLRDTGLERLKKSLGFRSQDDAAASVAGKEFLRRLDTWGVEPPTEDQQPPARRRRARGAF